MSGTKTGNRYFSHDSDAFLDSRIIKMRAKLGLAGYGAYWMIIERLRTADGYRHECDYEVFACLANSDAELFKSVIEDFDLFEFEENDGQTYFYSASLKRRMKHMDDIIEKRREAGRLGGEAKARNYQEAHEKEADDNQLPEQKLSKPLANAKQMLSNSSSKGLANCSKLNKTKLNQTKVEVKSNTEKPSTLAVKTHIVGSDKPTVDAVVKKNVQEERFNEFWKLYPKKVGKKAARQAWMRLRPNKELFEKIVQAVKTQKLSEQWTKENGKYIPHPTTWLNQGRWDDELPRGNGQTKIPDRNRIPEAHEYENPTDAEYSPIFQAWFEQDAKKPKEAKA